MIASKKHSGFTLIELLVTIGIVTILASIAVPTFAAMQRRMTLNGVSQELTDALRAAQTKAVSGQGGQSHGIRIAADGSSYSILTQAPAALPVVVSTVNLPGTITLSSGAADIVFKRLTGVPVTADVNQTATDPAQITVESGSSIIRIEVDASGRIYLN